MASNGTLSDISFPKAISADIDTEKYLQFLDKTGPGSARQLIVSFPVACPDPLPWTSALKKQHTFCYYWEKPSASTTIAALGRVRHLTAHGPDRFNAIQQSIEETQNATAHLNLGMHSIDSGSLFVGGFSFFDDLQTSGWQGYDAASFTMPECTLRKVKGHTIASVALTLDAYTSPGRLHDRISDIIRRYSPFARDGADFEEPDQAASPDERNPKTIPKGYKHWINTVDDAKKCIKRQKFGKVVLARRLKFSVNQSCSPFAVLHRLRERYPKCTSFLIQHEQSDAFLGCSPERLLSVDGDCIHTEALAGSIGRGSTAQQDQQLESKLLKSRKDHEEHAFVLNDIKALLAPLTREMDSTERPLVKKLTNVQHLYSPIRAKIEKVTHPLVILGRLHPTPAVGGTPRIPALQYIREHESFSRGWFAGPIGWISTTGESEFTVAIRSGLIGEDCAQLFAGCGIVADSNPETEWRETNLKFMPMLSALNYD
jgi:menaquinone-specific isochorismate synthase